MKVISTTDARKRIREVVEYVKETGKPVAIGRRTTPEVLVIRYPRYEPKLSDITNASVAGGAFDFLSNEPNLYSDKDLKEHYA